MMHLKRFDESEKTRIEDYLYNLYDTEPLHIDQVGDDVFFFVYSIENIPMDNILSETMKYLSSRRFSNYYAYWDLNQSRFAILLVSKEFQNNHPKLYVPNIEWKPHELATIPLFKQAKITKLPNNCSLIFRVNPEVWEFWPMEELDDPIRMNNKVDLQFYIYKYCT